jgi:hypothetical protein
VPDDTQPEEPWQAEPARRLLRYPLAVLGDWTITFTLASEDEVREGSTWLREGRIVIYVQEDWTAEKTANALAHEVGHVHDALFMTPRLRDSFMRARGLGWFERYVSVKWPSFTKREPRKRQRCGIEDFAEVFALRWAPPAEFQSTVRPPPSSDQLGRLDPFLSPPPG